MTRPYVLSTQQYACRCGGEHPQLTRLAGVPVLLCPACPDDALHVHIDKVGGVRIVTGDSEAPDRRDAELTAIVAVLREKLDTVLARLDALEAKMKRGAKE